MCQLGKVELKLEGKLISLRTSYISSMTEMASRLI